MCAQAHLHSCHVLHRDLKSANVLMHESGCVKIADFGLSRTCKVQAHGQVGGLSRTCMCRRMSRWEGGWVGSAAPWCLLFFICDLYTPIPSPPSSPPLPLPPPHTSCRPPSLPATANRRSPPRRTVGPSPPSPTCYCRPHPPSLPPCYCWPGPCCYTCLIAPVPGNLPDGF